MTENKKLEAVIFDLGGVIFGVSLKPVILKWSKSIGCNPQDIASKFKVDSFYERFETGEISPEEYRDHVCDVLNCKMSDEDFDKGWNSIYLDILPGVESVLQKLQGKVRLVVLTNTNQIHAQEWRPRYAEILKYFEKVFSSYEIGARKPQPESFQIVLNYLNIEPGKVVFIDDNPQNVQGSEAVGIKGIVATKTSDIMQKIEENM